MDSALALIKAVITTLNANVGVNALLAGRIYTDVPESATFPYLVLSADSEPFAANDFSGQTHTLRLQVFNQTSDVIELLGIRKACVEALDRKETSITLASGSLVKCEYSGSSTMFKEDDGKTWQAVAELEVIVV